MYSRLFSGFLHNHLNTIIIPLYRKMKLGDSKLMWQTDVLKQKCCQKTTISMLFECGFCPKNVKQLPFATFACMTSVWIQQQRPFHFCPGTVPICRQGKDNGNTALGFWNSFLRKTYWILLVCWNVVFATSINFISKYCNLNFCFQKEHIAEDFVNRCNELPRLGSIVFSRGIEESGEG